MRTALTRALQRRRKMRRMRSGCWRAGVHVGSCVVHIELCFRKLFVYWEVRLPNRGNICKQAVGLTLLSSFPLVQVAEEAREARCQAACGGGGGAQEGG